MIADSETRDTHGQSVVVVGAGIIGIACAHYLQRAGFRVTVIDKGAIAGECSHGNCGYLCPSHVLPLTEPGAIGTAFKSLFNPQDAFRVKPRLSPALWSWMWQFARRCNHRQMLTAGAHLKSILDSSLVEYQQLMREESLQCEWTENGLLYVFQTEAGLREFSETDRLLSEHFGVAANRISGSDLPDFEPALKPKLAGAYHYPHDVSIRPDLLNREWASRLRSRGVMFLENCTLNSLVCAGNVVTAVGTSQGVIPAGNVVLAAGAVSSQLGRMFQCKIPIEPGKGYSVTMERPEICPRHPMLFPEHRIGVSPFAEGYRLGSMMEFAGFDSTIPERRIQQLRDSAEPYLITPYSPGKQEAWFGWRPMTWDSLPIIGRTPKLANAYLATGHNMLGMSLATATGRLIAELMQGQTPHIDVRPFSPTRFA